MTEKLKDKLEDLWDSIYNLTIEPIVDFYDNIRYFIQRGKRGYSDRDVWNFDCYIADILKGGITDLRDKHSGYPTNLEPDEWDDILDTMIEGFDYYDKEDKLMDSEPYNDEVYMKEEPKLRKKLDKSLKLFAKHFQSLWD